MSATVVGRRAFPLLLLAATCGFTQARPAAGHPQAVVYQSPTELAVSPDGARLYVVCEGSDSLAVVDVRRRAVIGRVRVGRRPKGTALSPDGQTLYVTNEWSDTVSVINARTLRVTQNFATGFGPAGVTTDRTGSTLYVANSVSDDVSVIDSRTGAEIKRLAAGHSPHHLALSPDGSTVSVSNLLPQLGPSRTPPVSELTVIDTNRQRVVRREFLQGAATLRTVAYSPAGDFLLVALLRPKNLNPMVQVAQGWVITHGLGMVRFGPAAPPAQVLLDEIDRYFANPYGIIFTPDGEYAYVSSSGADLVTVVDGRALATLIAKASSADLKNYANLLSLSARFVRNRIPVGRDPRGLAASPDGRFVYVANRLSDSISIISVDHTSGGRRIGTIDLGGPRVLTALRRGEIIFQNARAAFQGQFSCSTCHPEDHLDGLAYDLEPDGLGRNIVQNRTLRAIAETAPYKWRGTNPDLETQCGPRISKFFFRSEAYPPDQLRDLVAFLKSIPLPPNRYRRPDGELTPAQQRGKIIFERTTKKDGSPLPEMTNCIFCHGGPHYTNSILADVGTTTPYDSPGTFKAPQLNNIYEAGPYLHDGSARTLEEIWTVFNPKDKHGFTSDLTKDQLNDLIEYLKTL